MVITSSFMTTLATTFLHENDEMIIKHVITNHNILNVIILFFDEEIKNFWDNSMGEKLSILFLFKKSHWPFCTDFCLVSISRFDQMIRYMKSR